MIEQHVVQVHLSSEKRLWCASFKGQRRWGLTPQEAVYVLLTASDYAYVPIRVTHEEEDEAFVGVWLWWDGKANAWRARYQRLNAGGVDLWERYGATREEALYILLLDEGIDLGVRLKHLEVC
jgi:hypothetical protein